MKNLKLLVVALVAMFGFIACEQHECNDYDHSADLVGTWTCLQEGYAEALVIKADGSALSTGHDGEEFWENVAGSFVVENGMVTMTFEDGDNFHGHFDIIPGMAFSIYTDEGNRFTFNYCKEDLSEEVVGMWVCNDAPAGADNDMAIISYEEDGSTTFTGILPDKDGYMLKVNTTYKVVGDLVFKKNAVQGDSNNSNYISSRLTYVPNGTAAGDIMVYKHYNGKKEVSSSYLRIKQYLELPGNSYNYSNIYVTNAKAKEAEIEFAGQTFNLATISGDFLDKMMKNILFNVSFPSADKIVYNCYINGENVNMPSPIVVEGNKMTIKKSAYNSVYKDIEVWTFQDQDNTQMHMYMPVKSFENFLANTAVEMKVKKGELDLNNTEAISAIYNGVANAIETINVSFIFKTAK